jgi:hypothetical protein
MSVSGNAVIEGPFIQTRLLHVVKLRQMEIYFWRLRALSSHNFKIIFVGCFWQISFQILTSVIMEFKNSAESPN